jgi:spore germination cell wall hydrolase CwlJ-like protein
MPVSVHIFRITPYKRPIHIQDCHMTLFRLLTLIPILALLAACDSKPEPVAASYGTNAQVCLAEALYFEARGTGEIGRRAVGEVILNRANDPQFPSTVCGVVDQRYNGSCQFSYRCNGSLTYNEPQALANANVTAYTLLTDRGEDITNGALFFHTSTMAPGWFGTLRRLGTFGNNIFYR